MATKKYDFEVVDGVWFDGEVEYEITEDYITTDRGIKHERYPHVFSIEGDVIVNGTGETGDPMFKVEYRYVVGWLYDKVERMVGEYLGELE